MNLKLCGAALAAVSFVGVASAETLATLDATVNVDNAFTAYISDSDSSLGTEFLTGDNWQVTYHGTFNFTQAGTFYLHVVATDFGAPAMFVGAFGLMNGTNSAAFVNGTQSLYTNATDWTAHVNSLAGASVGIADLGAVGSGKVWDGFVKPNISSDAHYIWHAGTGGEMTAVFTTVITVVPAPSTMGLAGLGMLAMGRRRR